MPIQFEEDDAPQSLADLKPRTATVVLKRVEAYTSKAGKEYIKVSARTTDDGEWLNEYMQPRRSTVATLCAAVGVEMPQDLTLHEEALIGLECRVKLSVEPAKDGYPAKYRVEKWIPATQAAAPAAAVPGTKPLNFKPKGPAITTGKVAKPQASAVEAEEGEDIPF
jgi:hypothetical protein